MSNSSQLGMFDAPPQSNLLEMAPDICRNRHKGNKQSEAANLKAEPCKAVMRERILTFVLVCGDRGTTSAEIEKLFGLAKNKFSGRITKLKADELIFDSGRERDGCAVLVGRKCWCNGSER